MRVSMVLRLRVGIWIRKGMRMVIKMVVRVSMGVRVTMRIEYILK